MKADVRTGRWVAEAVVCKDGSIKVWITQSKRLQDCTKDKSQEKITRGGRASR